jgi:MoaA/NifB/PqqE/SkfB family radical SAM enzyme
MDKRTIFKFIEKNEKDIVFVSLMGGEPLLHPDIEEIIDFLQAKDGIFVMIGTNGLLIEEKIDILKKVDHVYISIDGDEPIQEIVRQNSLTHILKGIGLLKKNKISISLNTVLTKYNINNLDYIVKLAKEKGIKFINIFPLHSGTDKTKKELEEIVPKKEDVKKAIDYLLKNEDILFQTKPTLHLIRNNFPRLNKKSYICKERNYIHFYDLDFERKCCCTNKRIYAPSKDRLKKCRTCNNILNIELHRFTNILRILKKMVFK